MSSNKVEKCPVCYNELTLKNVMQLRCDHQLCKDCYYNWVDNAGKNSCPCCRDEIMKTDNYRNEIEEKMEIYKRAALVWKSKRDRRRQEYSVAMSRLRGVNESISSIREQREELVQETARYLCLQNKYKNQIRKLRVKVSVSMSPYELIKYYKNQMNENLKYAENKARKVFKGVLNEMKEIFSCRITEDRGVSDLFLLSNGIKYNKQLNKKNSQIPLWDISDMFDNEVGPMSEEDIKLEQEYNDKKELHNESLREMIECEERLKEDPKSLCGYKVQKAFGVKRQWVEGNYDYSSNGTNNYEIRPIIWKFNKRINEWIWVHDEKEKIENYKNFDLPYESEGVNEVTDKLMNKYCKYDMTIDQFKFEEENELGEFCINMFEEEEDEDELEEGEIVEVSDDDSIPSLLDSGSETEIEEYEDEDIISEELLRNTTIEREIFRLWHNTRGLGIGFPFGDM